MAGWRGARAHLMISCSRCSSWRCRIMTPSMMARSSGVRCDRSGMSAMAGGDRVRGAGPPRAAVLCPRRELGATPLGGLFNNAGRANGAPPCSDVSAAIDRGGRARQPPPPAPPPPATRDTTYMRAHINYATIYVHICTHQLLTSNY